MLGVDPQGLVFQWLREEASPLYWLSWGALGNHNYISCAYMLVLGWVAHGKQENTGSQLGKLVRMGMSQIILPSQNPREVVWPQGFDWHMYYWVFDIVRMSVHWPHTSKSSCLSHAKVISWSSPVSNICHCRKKSLKTFAKYHLKTEGTEGKWSC